MEGSVTDGYGSRDARRVWVAALLGVGALSMVALGVAADSLLMRAAYPVGAVAVVVLLVALLTSRWTVQQTVNGLLVVGLVLGVALGLSVFWADAGDVETGFVVFRAVTFVSGVTFLALGPRAGTVISLVYVGLATVLLLATGLPLMGRGDLRPGLVENVGLLLAMVAVFRTLSARLESLERSAEEASASAALAYRDDLTALPNRRQMALHLGEAISRARAGGPVDAVVMFDLDHFKAINDTMGHNVGDDVLRRTAAIASAAVREDDIVGRWGGEEFVALLHGADEPQAIAVAERCRRALEGVTGRARATASFGVTTLSLDDDVNRVIGRADAALYDAKQSGRNRIVTRPPQASDVRRTAEEHARTTPRDLADPPGDRAGGRRPGGAEDAPATAEPHAAHSTVRAEIRLDAHLDPDDEEGRHDRDADAGSEEEPPSGSREVWRPR